MAFWHSTGARKTRALDARAAGAAAQALARTSPQLRHFERRPPVRPVSGAKRPDRRAAPFRRCDALGHPPSTLDLVAFRDPAHVDVGQSGLPCVRASGISTPGRPPALHSLPVIIILLTAASRHTTFFFAATAAFTIKSFNYVIPHLPAGCESAAITLPDILSQAPASHTSSSRAKLPLHNRQFQIAVMRRLLKTLHPSRFVVFFLKTSSFATTPPHSASFSHCETVAHFYSICSQQRSFRGVQHSFGLSTPAASVVQRRDMQTQSLGNSTHRIPPPPPYASKIQSAPHIQFHKRVFQCSPLFNISILSKC